MNTQSQIKQTRLLVKIGKKVLKVFGIIIAAIAIFSLIGAVLHATYFEAKYEQVKPYGQLVDVEDGQMHVYSIGNGEKTIVLLPGLGIPLPSADFGPLMRKLSEKYTVVCVEYFGVGFSSGTSRPRTTENYVEETRTALRQAGHQPPYVLMPHSISGVYSEYYAAKYPTEVEAVISLDGTPTQYYEAMPALIKSVFLVMKFPQAIGATSLLGILTTNKPRLLSLGYTEREINDAITMTGFSMNATLIEQMSNPSEFIKQTKDLPFPESVPYFKIISRDTYEKPNPQLPTTPQEFQHKHLERIGAHAKYVILDGNHFIYLNNIDRIAEITDDFLLEADQ